MLSPKPIGIFTLVRYSMAFWNILGIAPTTNENEIGYAYACAVCGAAGGQAVALPTLEDAYSKALEFARRGLPHVRDMADDARTEERTAALVQLFQRSKKLAESHADENAWLEFTSSPAFLELQDDPHFIDWLVRLSSSLYPDMASALYTAYGFASLRAVSQHPTSGRLLHRLTEYCQLPADDSPLLSQQDIIRLTASCLNGILALQKEPQSAHLWQQVFQLPDFLILRHQPHFLLALGHFVNRHTLSGECLFTLAEACTEKMRRSPCAEALAKRLPQYGNAQAWSPPELFAGFLLQDGGREFFSGARNKLFFLLERTAENFQNSSQRHPWDYVFARPQFSLVKRDPVFLERLMAFQAGRDLPLKFWQALHDAYLEDFLKLKDTEKDSRLWLLRELVRARLTEKQDAQDTAGRSRRISPPLLGAASVLYLIAALWICFQSPLIGVPLLLAPLAFLFFG